MGVGPQRPGARHGPRRASSALNVRLLLAVAGLVTCAVLMFPVVRAGLVVLAIGLAALAAVAVADIVAIQRRRSARRRSEPGPRPTLE